MVMRGRFYLSHLFKVLFYKVILMVSRSVTPVKRTVCEGAREKNIDKRPRCIF